MTSTLACLGVAEHSGGIGFGEIGADADKKKGTGAGASAEEAMAPALDALVKFRDEIRALAKGAAVDKGALMRACDALRDEGLPAIGVKLDDRDGGALWKMSSPEELQKELAREAEAKAKKELETRRKKEEAAKRRRRRKPPRASTRGRCSRSGSTPVCTPSTTRRNPDQNQGRGGGGQGAEEKTRQSARRAEDGARKVFGEARRRGRRASQALIDELRSPR